MSSKIKIWCPGCQSQYSIPSDIGDKRLRCKKCDRRFTIAEAHSSDPNEVILAAEIIDPLPEPPTFEPQASMDAIPDPFGTPTPINNPYLYDNTATPAPATPALGSAGHYNPAAAPMAPTAALAPTFPQHKTNLMMVPAILGAIIFSLAMAGAAWIHTFKAASRSVDAGSVAQNAVPAHVRDTPTAKPKVVPAAKAVPAVPPTRPTDDANKFVETETKKPKQTARETGPTAKESGAEAERRRIAAEERNERRKKYAAERDQKRLAREREAKDKARKLRLKPAAGEKPTENLIMRVREASWGPNALVVTDNGYMAIADNKTVRIFDWQRKSELSEYDQFKELGNPSAIDMTNDGKKLIIGGEKGRIELFDVDDSGHLIVPPVVLQEQGDNIVELALNADATRAVSADDKQKVILWDLETNQAISEASDFGRRVVTEIHFSSDSKEFSLTDGKSVIGYSTSDGKQIKKMEIDVGHCHDAAFSTDGSLIAVSGTKGLLTFTESGEVVAKSKVTKGVQWALRFADDKHFFSCGTRSVAKIDATSGELVKNFEIPDTSYIKEISISPDGTKMAVTSASARDDVFLIDVSQ